MRHQILVCLLQYPPRFAPPGRTHDCCPWAQTIRPASLLQRPGRSRSLPGSVYSDFVPSRSTLHCLPHLPSPLPCSTPSYFCVKPEISGLAFQGSIRYGATWPVSLHVKVGVTEWNSLKSSLAPFASFVWPCWPCPEHPRSPWPPHQQLQFVKCGLPRSLPRLLWRSRLFGCWLSQPHDGGLIVHLESARPRDKVPPPPCTALWLGAKWLPSLLLGSVINKGGTVSAPTTKVIGKNWVLNLTWTWTNPVILRVVENGLPRGTTLPHEMMRRLMVASFVYKKETDSHNPHSLLYKGSSQLLPPVIDQNKMLAYWPLVTPMSYGPRSVWMSILSLLRRG